MVRHGSSWFVMFRHGSWCFIMVRDVSWWFIMVCHGSWSFMVVRHGSSWFTVMVRHGSLSWFVMVHCHGSLSWFVMVRHGSLSWFRHGSSWFVMCYSLKFSRKGHVTLYLANQGLKFTIKSHFWWDFLFSPFHLKSIPLKSSAKNEARATTRTSKPQTAISFLTRAVLLVEWESFRVLWLNNKVTLTQYLLSSPGGTGT